VKPLLLALCLSLPVAPHDFFLSILTIRHDPNSRTLDLTWQWPGAGTLEERVAGTMARFDQAVGG